MRRVILVWIVLNWLAFPGAAGSSGVDIAHVQQPVAQHGIAEDGMPYRTSDTYTLHATVTIVDCDLTPQDQVCQ